MLTGKYLEFMQKKKWEVQSKKWETVYGFDRNNLEFLQLTELVSQKTWHTN